ncbi:hypothetical protein JB92DRAFT_2836463 [Gautieria morchelliformis]|nr:hypothetical protein JB92DRAFT_2836463 [Gautieria morchelliformis]
MPPAEVRGKDWDRKPTVHSPRYSQVRRGMHVKKTPEKGGTGQQEMEGAHMPGGPNDEGVFTEQERMGKCADPLTERVARWEAAVTEGFKVYIECTNTLAGSFATLTGCTLGEAIKCATYNPAAVLTPARLSQLPQHRQPQWHAAARRGCGPGAPRRGGVCGGDVGGGRSVWPGRVLRSRKVGLLLLLLLVVLLCGCTPPLARTDATDHGGGPNLTTGDYIRDFQSREKWLLTGRNCLLEKLPQKIPARSVVASAQSRGSGIRQLPAHLSPISAESTPAEPIIIMMSVERDEPSGVWPRNTWQRYLVLLGRHYILSEFRALTPCATASLRLTRYHSLEANWLHYCGLREKSQLPPMFAKRVAPPGSRNIPIGQ